MKTNDENIAALRVVRQAIEDQFGKPARAALDDKSGAYVAAQHRIAAKLIVSRIHRVAARLTVDELRTELYELADEIETRLESR